MKSTDRLNPTVAERIESLSEKDLNPKTREFLNSLSSQYSHKKNLSPRQLSALQQIESRFSSVEQEKLTQWSKTYEQDYKKDALIIARYYIKAGYYTHISTDIISYPEYVPPKSRFKKMMGNKYAQKVLNETRKPAKFEEGAKVQVRANAGSSDYESYLRSYTDRICFVLETDRQVINAVAGGKRYTVLPMGSSDPIDIDERHLMKVNKRGKYYNESSN